MNNAIEVNALTKRFGDVLAVDDLTFTVPEGTVTGLRARGGLRVDIRWRDGRLLGALITADRDTLMRVRYGDVAAAEQFTAAEPRWIEPRA